MYNKVLLIESNNLMRDALQKLLALENSIEVVQAYESVQMATKNIKSRECNIIILSTNENYYGDMEYIKKIKENNQKISIILITDIESECFVVEALANGVNGIIHKNDSFNKLMTIIECCCMGNMCIPDSMANKLIKVIEKREYYDKENMKYINDLSDREKQIASLMVSGFSNKKIATVSYITEGTVKNYVSSIYNKIGINDRTEAVLFLKKNGI